MSFTQAITVRLAETDAAGVLYFSNQLRIAHEAYESFLESVGLPIAGIMKSDFRLPIVHAEADFTQPVRVGDAIEVEVTADRIGETSFRILYRFRRRPRTAVGSAQTVHVCVDAATGRKRRLPEPLRAALKKIV